MSEIRIFPQVYALTKFNIVTLKYFENDDIDDILIVVWKLRVMKSFSRPTLMFPHLSFLFKYLLKLSTTGNNLKYQLFKLVPGFLFVLILEVTSGLLEIVGVKG